MSNTQPSPASASAPPRAQPQPRSAFAHFDRVTTRWSDNDVYGHVNNVVYYSWFDAAVNRYLMERGALYIHQGETIGLVIETQCNYFAPVAFPQAIDVGVRVASMGRMPSIVPGRGVAALVRPAFGAPIRRVRGRRPGRPGRRTARRPSG